MKVALYVRVSTVDRQTVENQVARLTEVAKARAWEIVATFSDNGISGSKSRDQRPGLDKLLKDATRGKFQMVMCWSVDRLGRSLYDLLDTLKTLEAAGAGLYLDQQALDTSTPAGKAMFQMAGVFAEFERAMIQARVKAGMDRARLSGKHVGRPRLDPTKVEAARAELAKGTGVRAVAELVGLSTGSVSGIKATMTV
jgi:DNA invertase Pin-like site-specific DNA recombinase